MSFEKHLNILDYAIQNLWRRKLKNLSVVLVFSAVIFLVASFQLTTSALVRSAQKSLSFAPELIVQKMVAGRQESIPLHYQEKLQTIFGIQTLVPRIWGYYFDEVNGANYTIVAMNPDLLPSDRPFELSLTDGGSSPNVGEAVLGNTIYESLDLGGRKVFSFYRPDLSLKSFRIAGTFSKNTDMLTGDTMLIPLEDGRDLFGLSHNVVTDFCIYIRNENEINTIAKKIANLLPDCRVITRPQIQKTYTMVFGWRSGFASVCLLTALTAFIIFSWDKASGLSAEEKKEIAILKILGWQTADILALRFWEGLLIAFFSFVTGYTAAFVHVIFFAAGFFKPVLVGWSVLEPELNLLPDFLFGDILLILSLSVLPYLAATVIPAWRSSIVPPDNALH